MLQIIVKKVVALIWNVVWNVVLQACLNASNEVAKKNYHNTVNKLINTQKNFKVYWSLSKIFLNNKKISIIPTMFLENRIITDFKEKAELFNFFLF